MGNDVLNLPPPGDIFVKTILVANLKGGVRRAGE
jgi:hypothetical protein